MSSSAIRTSARALCNEPAWPAPFQETISEGPEPAALPALWSTVQFDGGQDDSPGLGRDAELRETGRMTFIFFGAVGQGDSATLAAAEAAAPLIRAWSWPDHTFLEQISAPVDDRPGGEGNWYRIEIAVDYERDHT